MVGCRHLALIVVAALVGCADAYADGVRRMGWVQSAASWRTARSLFAQPTVNPLAPTTAPPPAAAPAPAPVNPVEAAARAAAKVKEEAEKTTEIQANATATQGLKTVDQAALSAEVEAKALAVGEAQKDSDHAVKHIEQEFKDAEKESKHKADEALEKLAANANLKAKAVAADRIATAVKNAEGTAADLHTSGEHLKESAATSHQAAEQASHFAVNAAKTAINEVNTMGKQTAAAAMNAAQEARFHIAEANEEVEKAQLVTKLSSQQGVDAKNVAIKSKLEAQGANAIADAAVSQTEVSKAAVEVTRREIEEAKKSAAAAVNEARNAVGLAKDLARGKTPMAMLRTPRAPKKMTLAKKSSRASPKETFGEGTHEEEFGHEYTPVDGPKNLKEPNPAEDKAWNREMHRNLMNYDGHGDYIRDGRTPRSGAERSTACLLILAAVAGRLLL